jgi:hypothetical protein
LATQRRRLKQAGRPEPGSPAVIRFSGADGKVLSWTASSDRVRTDLRVRSGIWGRTDRSAGQPSGPPSAVANLSEAVDLPIAHARGASVARTAKNSFVDLTVVAVDQPFFIIGALLVIAIVIAAIVFAFRFIG